ncbi:beta-1,4-N-acetylgalactosaminyltransferase 3 isoform X1 [Nothobranchius furzeri]|uniref:Beta-1,4-N-acetylgalactosaminyltransferase n=2 Tax=Nothobranchius furzeri TaxID=105023 RepID=A0A1A8AUR4_NOTFU|nr:beta-1,4-N-acetylgalactosaminyltransferase 3 isoform X1 [Nothobranchius furzeri]KAF7224530.1 4-N-acetylgalactosaminyltransferase 3-like [Nothobranchius furzeri]
MIATFFPLKKLRRNGKYFLFGAILLAGALVVYHEMVVAWSNEVGVIPDADGSNLKKVTSDQRDKRNNPADSVEDSASWISSFIPQIWKPEFKGQANLHVFEDWCGGSTADLRKNPHYPLYPHSRTMVQKLAVTPQWTNYGLRIFGYLHPFADGDFVFALSSDDNSEFWLSTNHSPLNLHLLVWVGKTGKEWTAPGEFEKYANQTSRPVRLSSQRRYYFEVIHKQNDRGTDHVEVAWQLQEEHFRFTIIESKHISLYVNESSLLMSDVDHIPQTAASHQRTSTKQHSSAADMLMEDPRDTLHKVRLINSELIRGVLPDCLYKPSYIIKDFPLMRYQGLQFVHMSYIYPNDYTRLTHMETENSCFYPESPYYMKRFGFSRYMRLDRPNEQRIENGGRDFDFQRRKSVQNEDNSDNEAYERENEVVVDQTKNAYYEENGDDYDDYILKHRRKLFSFMTQEANNTLDQSSDMKPHTEDMLKMQVKVDVPQPLEEPRRTAQPLQTIQASSPCVQPTRSESKQTVPVQKIRPVNSKRKVRPKRKRVQSFVKPEQNNSSVVKAKQQPAVRSEKLIPKKKMVQMSHQLMNTQIQTIKQSPFQNKSRGSLPRTKTTAASQFVKKGAELNASITWRFTTPRRSSNRVIKRSKEVVTHSKNSNVNMAKKQIMNIHDKEVQGINKNSWSDRRREGSQREESENDNRADSRINANKVERFTLWDQQGDNTEGVEDEDLTPAPVFDTQVNWNQTFQVNQLDLHAKRSDWIDLNCNISGNLLLHPTDALPIVKAFMDQLNEKHKGRFTLVRVVNVVKRVDGSQGSRYLLELELKDLNGQLLRLTQYVYALIRHGRPRSRNFGLHRSRPQLVLCNPVGFRWHPFATVHFIVPVKNQARWVLQLIADMEQLFKESGDSNFNLIITDYSSTDMDVKKALQKSSLPRYQYVKLSGNFERSAGLQAGVDLISDDHSIVFLCDLHIHFPPSIIDTIRKHCVEGYMAFAPIVLRLDCGMTPAEAVGFWEVNGFGLLGIYKSDLDAIGGMNTRDFRDRWGGEDWELIDRIMQGGLEVERIYLRNFYHYYHSKRGMWNRRMSASLR